MKGSILSRLSRQSMWNEKRIYFPYLLALILLFSIEFIIISLMYNDYIANNSPNLQLFLGIGIFLASILVFIIALYANNYVNHSQQKTLGLYSVLGLEKKHLRRIIGTQNMISWLIVTIGSLVVGYVGGQVLFILLNRLMRDTGAGLMDYPFSLPAVGWTVLLLVMTFIFFQIINIGRIAQLKPIEILSQANAGETEPKSRLWLGLIGLITLGAGYYLAMTTTGIIESMTTILGASLLVIIGTYALFISIVIVVLKLLKSNKTLYYKPNNFLSISGMLYRMKSNAVSLASIAVLCSGIILTATTTLTLYRGMEAQIETVVKNDYEITYIQSTEDTKEDAEVYLADLQASLQADIPNMVAPKVIDSLMVSANLNGTTLEKLSPRVANDPVQPGRQLFIVTETIDDFNQTAGKSIILAQDEVLMAANFDQGRALSEINIVGENMSVTQIDEGLMPGNLGVEFLYIIVPNEEVMQSIQQTYVNIFATGEEAPSLITTDLVFDVADNNENIEAKVNEVSEDYRYAAVTSALEVRETIYAINGGLLFIGIIVIILLLVGTILMLYFKQISEGYDDQGNYKIMQQVGLPKTMIRKTIRNQIIWVFALPIMVAIVHNLAAANVMGQALGILGMTDIGLYMQDLTIVSVIFMLIYLLFYYLTSRIYYNIVNE